MRGRHSTPSPRDSIPMRDDHALMAKAADLYYVRGRTQQQIAVRPWVTVQLIERHLGFPGRVVVLSGRFVHL